MIPIRSENLLGLGDKAFILHEPVRLRDLPAWPLNDNLVHQHVHAALPGLPDGQPPESKAALEERHENQYTLFV